MVQHLLHDSRTCRVAQAFEMCTSCAALTVSSMHRFEKQRLEMLNEGIRGINAPALTLDELVSVINK